MYGSTPLEDIIDYNQLARSLTEWSSTNDNNTINQSSIAEGIGGITYGVGGGLNVATSLARVYVGQVHVRKTMIQGLDLSATLDIASTGLAGFANGAGAVPNQFGGTTLASHPLVVGTNSIRRYQVQLALGLFNQDKLIPVKFMASQLAIEITLAQESDCMFYQSAMTTAVNPPTYVVGNINLIPEILEFDDMYNANFIEGLENGGIPIKFSTWNNYKIGTGGGSTCNLQIQERSRSVKAIFALLKRDPPSIATDSHATFFTTASSGSGTATPSTMLDFQFRIGGRYYPAQPVQCSTAAVSGSSTVFNNGGAEAWVELQKALNVLGDYRITPNCNVLSWAVAPYFNSVNYTAPVTNAGNCNTLPEFDYRDNLVQYFPNGHLLTQKRENTTTVVGANNNAFVGNIPSCCFAMAVDLETSNGVEISGLNAEEQNDISLIARYTAAQTSSFTFEVFTYVDAMIVLKPRNVLDLIQ